MSRNVRRPRVVLADRHSTFAEEKAMTKGKQEKERKRERGRWSNYRRGTAVHCSSACSLLPSDFTVRQSQNQSQTDESSLPAFLRREQVRTHCKGGYAKGILRYQISITLVSNALNFVWKASFVSSGSQTLLCLKYFA